MGGLCELMGSLCAGLKEWHMVGIYHLLQEWQTLIAGGVAFIAGLLTVKAIKKQIAEARRSAHAQIAAMQLQLDDAKAARAEIDQRRRRVIARVVKAEGRRLEAASTALRHTIGEGGRASGKREQLITTSPLLRGEREDVALLDDTTLDLVEQAADVVNGYNATMETNIGATGGVQFNVPAGVVDALDRLYEIAVQLKQ